MTIESIRPAVEGDLVAISEIYDHYVLTSHATFDIEPVGIDHRREWLEGHSGGRYRVFAGVSDGRVIGFARSGRYRPRPAYDTTVETSVYVDHAFVGRGVGSALYQVLFDTLAHEDVHRALAGIGMPNDASVALHERFGFRRAAHFSEQGRKFGRYWDVDWYERPVGESEALTAPAWRGNMFRMEQRLRPTSGRRDPMSNQPDTHDMVVTRTLDAPRERVWQAWSDPDQVMKWWGPQGFTSPMCQMDFREGGTTLVSMRSDQGWELVNSWAYRSIEPMERIEFVQGFADGDGNPLTPADVGLPPAIPEEVRHVLTFSALDDATTELTVHEFGYPDEQIIEVSRAGMEQVLDKLAAMLAEG